MGTSFLMAEATSGQVSGKRGQAHGKWTGFKVSAVAAVSASNTSVTIDGTHTSVPPARRAAQVRSPATSVDGVAAQIEPGRPGTPTTGRDADTTPFNSGGYMITTITMNGSTYFITARHSAFKYGGSLKFADYVARSCYQQAAPSASHYGNPNASFGTFSSLGGPALLTSAGDGLAFVNAWNSSTSELVIQLSDLGVNDMVCTDGGNSGEHCNVKVTSLPVQFLGMSYVTTRDTVTDIRREIIEGTAGAKADSAAIRSRPWRRRVGEGRPATAAPAGGEAPSSSVALPAATRRRPSSR